jgi:hypothetical protein
VILTLGVGLRATTPRFKKICKFALKCYKGTLTWTDSLDKRLKLRKMEVRFCMRKVRNLYRAGSLMRISKELSKCS